MAPKDSCADGWYTHATILRQLKNVEFSSFITILNRSRIPLSRMKTKRHIHRRCGDLKLRVKEFINRAPGKISLTTDAWSSRVHRGYIVVTGHWVGIHWSLRSCILSFERFLTPHTAYAAVDILYRFIDEWNLNERVQSIKFENTDTCAVIGMLHGRLVAMSKIQITCLIFMCGM